MQLQLGNPVEAFDAFGSPPLDYEERHDVASVVSKAPYQRRPEARLHGLSRAVAIIPHLVPSSLARDLTFTRDKDLSQTAKDSKAAWTWGGVLSTHHAGATESVINTLFAVGHSLTA